MLSPELRRRKTRHNISSKIDLSNDFEQKNAKNCDFFAIFAPNARARVRHVCMSVRAGVFVFWMAVWVCWGVWVMGESRLGWIARSTRVGVEPDSSRTCRTSKTSRTGYWQKALPQRQAHGHCMPKGTKPLKCSTFHPTRYKTTVQVQYRHTAPRATGRKEGVRGRTLRRHDAIVATGCGKPRQSFLQIFPQKSGEICKNTLTHLHHRHTHTAVNIPLPVAPGVGGAGGRR